MMFGAEGDTAIAPIDCVGCESKIGFHVRPSSSVFHTPPLTAPARKVWGWPGTPVMARVRPPRKGPTSRHCKSCVIPAVVDCACDTPTLQLIKKTTQSTPYERN